MTECIRLKIILTLTLNYFILLTFNPNILSFKVNYLASQAPPSVSVMSLTSLRVTIVLITYLMVRLRVCRPCNVPNVPNVP